MAVTGEDRQGKQGLGKGIKILILLLVVLAALQGYYIVSQMGEESGFSLLGREEKVSYEILDMGSIVVNLKDQGASYYLRVNPVLEYPENARLTKELSAKKPLLEDSIITCLRNKTISEVKPVNGVEKLKEDLIEVINSNLSAGEVESIYFTEYLLN